MTIKLHLGCGKKNFGKDWDHIDVNEEYDHIKSHDIINLPYEENTVDLIYASHVFEYFDREEASEVLLKWKKVLKPNGILRIAVPDFESMVKLYLEKGYPLSKFLGPLYGKWSVNNDNIYHKTTYDFDSLKNILEEARFNNIEKWNWRKVEHSDFDDYSQAYVPHMDKENGTLISLNVECCK